MKKWLSVFIFLLAVSGMSVQAQDFTLKSGSYQSGTYAGDNEEDYNYYMVKTNKKGYLAITAKTSDHKNLFVDICDQNKQVVASDISIEDKKNVLHACDKSKVYYIRVKGTQGITYKISYKITTLNLKYAKKYTYTVTNASLQEKQQVVIPMKVSNSGILHFMVNTSNPLTVKYYNSKKKAVSENATMIKKNLSGIGIASKGKYYVHLYNPENTTIGTTTLKDIKYQVDNVFKIRNGSKGKAKSLSKGKYVRMLVPAGKKTTAWFKIRITKKQKLNISIDSQMMQNNGKNLQLYICNNKGKKLNVNPIIINGESSVIYKKKYIMKYPKTVFGTTSAFPEGTYYIKVESKTKTSSGAFKIKWN